MSIRPWMILLLFLTCAAPGHAREAATAENGTDLAKEPRLVVLPLRLDFGLLAPGQAASQRLAVTNGGRKMLKWQAQARKAGTAPEGGGRYIGFRNPETAGSGLYKMPPGYRDVLSFSGNWGERGGFPVGSPRCSLRIQGTGRGMHLYYFKEEAGGRFSVTLNGRPVADVDTRGLKREGAEFVVADGLPPGELVVTVAVKEGQVTFEGIRILKEGTSKTMGRFLTILPDSGVTTTEVDYVTIGLDTKKMTPGSYRGFVDFTSNGGEESVEVLAEITPEAAAKWIDVIRYYNGRDRLFSVNPQNDAALIRAGNYVKEGLAFRLFAPSTPGTVEFYRWYSPSRGAHFYSADRLEGERLAGDYRFDGSLGNIATTRLPRTRELYRWRHRKGDVYFFTTDPRAEGMEKKGYRFDGIVGYVH